jgi:AcrR family transcriptional regulator
MTAPTRLRERQKQQTREEIAHAAMELFLARGFDAVTVAEVADAAGVSEKTVYNHFSTKEDLVFPDVEQRWMVVLDGIRDRAPGTSLVEPFRTATRELLDQVATGAVDEITARPRLVMGSKALRERLFVRWEQEAALLAPIIAAEVGDDGTNIVPAVVARTLAWTHRVTFRAAFTRLIAGEDHREVARDLRKQSEEAYALLEAGLGNYGR